MDEELIKLLVVYSPVWLPIALYFASWFVISILALMNADLH